MLSLKSIFIIGTTLLAPSLAHAFQGSLYTDFGMNHLKGFVQTPRGGDIGSSSFQRPSFQEMQLEQDHWYDLGVKGQWGDYFLDLNYLSLHPHAEQILEQNLITHAQWIPQGDNFHLTVDYAWYTLTLGKNFGRLNNRWIFTPLLQGNFLTYDYAFSAPEKASSRSFNLLATSLGLEIQYALTPALTLDLSGAVTMPFSQLKMMTAHVEIQYQIISIGYFALSPRFKAGFFQLDYEDLQPMPNHLRYTAWPYASIGLVISFTSCEQGAPPKTK